MTAHNAKTKKQPQQRNIQITHLITQFIKNQEHHIHTKYIALKTEYDIFLSSLKRSRIMRFRTPVYNVYRLDCLNRLDGGVCTLVRDCFKVGRLVKDFFHLLAPDLA